MHVRVGGLAHTVGDRDRIVAADDGAEISRGGELMVQPAIDDEEGLAVADLAIDDARQIHARLGHQPPTQLDREPALRRSEEHTSELQSLMRTSYAVFCLKKKNNTTQQTKILKTTRTTQQRDK